jgi:hypothetical protein
MKKIFPFVISLAIICSTNLGAAEEKKWWNEEDIIKNTIVSGLVLGNSYASLTSKEKYTDMMSNTFDLLLLFYNLKTKHSLNILASLASYNLDGAASEIYKCVIKSKGKDIVPFLDELSRTGEDECISKFGSPKNMQGTNFSVCQSESDYRSRLEELKSQKCVPDK